jgi:hypothetical protein
VSIAVLAVTCWEGTKCCLCCAALLHVFPPPSRRLWQDRPLSAELVTCAAADVAYLIPLMELQVRHWGLGL